MNFFRRFAECGFRKLKTHRIFLAGIIFFATRAAYGFELPEKILQWRCISENIVRLIPSATSEDLGRVVYKNYSRENLSGTLEIILTEGAGTGELYVPEEVRDAKGVMPSGESYKIIDIEGRAGILETREYLPLVLAVRAGEDIIITIETSALNEKELTEFARELIMQK